MSESTHFSEQILQQSSTDGAAANFTTSSSSSSSSSSVSTSTQQLPNGEIKTETVEQRPDGTVVSQQVSTDASGNVISANSSSTSANLAIDAAPAPGSVKIEEIELKPAAQIEELPSGSAVKVEEIVPTDSAVKVEEIVPTDSAVKVEEIVPTDSAVKVEKIVPTDSAVKVEVQNGVPAAESSSTSTSTSTPAQPSSVTGPLTKDEAEKQAFKQIEFYFSDVNLPFDKFLWTLSRQDDGWVPIATLTSFKRMRALRDVLGEEAIAPLIRASSELLEVDEEGKRVRRRTPITRQRDAFERSIYAKGFGEETETTQQEIEQFFAQFGDINVVRMRREDAKHGPRKFKGSVFVEFASADQMATFLSKASASEDAIKYGDSPLVIMTKGDYCDMKIKEKGIEASASRPSRGPGGAPIARPGKFNAFIEMEREAKGLPSSEEARKSHGQGKSFSNGNGRASSSSSAPVPKRSDPLVFTFNDSPLVTREDETVDPDSIVFPSSSVIGFSNAGYEGSWKELKDHLLTVAPTSFIEFPMGSTSGAAGFKDSLPEDKFQTIKDMHITIGGQELVFERVDEAKAKQFYVDRANFRAKYMIDQREANAKNGGSGSSFFGRGGGRGGGGGGRGGRGGGGGFRGGRGGGGRGGHGHGGGAGKRKRNADEDRIGSRSGGEAPSLGSGSGSKRAKEE